MGMFWLKNISSGSKLFIILLLIATSESLVCFIWNDSKLVDLLFFRSLIIVIHSLSALVNADTESSANLLSFFVLRIAFVKCCNTKHVGIIPAYT